MGETVKYLRVIRKWWWVILLLCGATVGTMVTLSVLTETEYEATVTVQVSAPPPQETPLFSDFGRQGITEQIEQTRNSLSEFLLEGNAIPRAIESLPEINARASDVREKMVVDLPKSSQLMRIYVRASDPESAAMLANAIVEQGLELYGEMLAKPTANTRQFIEQELETSRKELIDAEAALAQFQITNKVGSLHTAVDDQYRMIRNLKQNSDLARAEGNLAKATALEDISLEREIELQNMIGLLSEYNALIEHVDRARASTNFLMEKRDEAQVKENQILKMGSIQIITQARPPRRPVAFIDNKLIVLGAVVSFLGGVLLTFLLEYMSLSGASHSRERVIDRRGEVVGGLPDQTGEPVR